MAIPITFLTVVIKKASIDAVCCGGLEIFLRSHRGAVEDDHFIALAFMSGGDLQQFVDALRLKGLEAARDFAVGEMHHGEWEACEGIAFRPAESDGPFQRWEAYVR